MEKPSELVTQGQHSHSGILLERGLMSIMNHLHHSFWKQVQSWLHDRPNQRGDFPPGRYQSRSFRMPLWVGPNDLGLIHLPIRTSYYKVELSVRIIPAPLPYESQVKHMHIPHLKTSFIKLVCKHHPIKPRVFFLSPSEALTQ